ncbi:MAG: DMT family transporter [Deltaproteobacteria bacterium]|nr:DMT family transporter [Deltaproteobacteria bacterium]
MSKDSTHAPPARAFFFGFVAVLIFSFTLPAMRLAVASLDPLLVALGRSLAAACVAGPILYWTKQPLPSQVQLRGLSLVILGIVIGFPLFVAIAMKKAPASHGAVVLGLLPLGTSLVAALRARERPVWTFWLAAILGSVVVLAFAWSADRRAFGTANLSLLLGVILGALGYAEGGRLAKEMGGWRVICWSLVLASPLLLLGVLLSLYWHGLEGTNSAWLGFFYLSFFSAFLGFFAWYHAMALGGIAKISQLQLLQPFLTLLLAALFLGEDLNFNTGLAMLGVAVAIFLAQRSRVRKA